MKTIQQFMFAFLDMRFAGIQKFPSGKKYILCNDLLNNHATYAYPEDAAPQEIFDHTQEKRKQFGLEIDYSKRELSDVENAN